MERGDPGAKHFAFLGQDVMLSPLQHELVLQVAQLQMLVGLDVGNWRHYPQGKLGG